MLTLQILSVNKTKKMIFSIAGLEFNKPVYYETIFIFVIFAFNVILQSLSRVLFTDLRNTIDTRVELIFWEAIFGSLAALYLISYIFYINILQTVWSFKHTITYECPILCEEVPLPVYIMNRCLIRERQVREFQNKGAESFYSCAEDQVLLLEKHGFDLEKVNNLPLIELFVNPENYRAQACQNLMTYNVYRKSITNT